MTRRVSVVGESVKNKISRWREMKRNKDGRAWMWNLIWKRQSKAVSGISYWIDFFSIHLYSRHKSGIKYTPAPPAAPFISRCSHDSQAVKRQCACVWRGSGNIPVKLMEITDRPLRNEQHNRCGFPKAKPKPSGNLRNDRKSLFNWLICLNICELMGGVWFYYFYIL